MHYFGPWDDPQGALEKYLEQKDALHAGRAPRAEAGPASLRVKDVCNEFVRHKDSLLENGEIGPRFWADCKEAGDLLVAHLGKHRLVADLGPADFAALRAGLAKRFGPVRLGNVIQRIRSVFKLALDNGLIDRPVIFGQGFARPSKHVLRRHRAEQGPKLFAAEEVRRMIGAADQPLKAMLLLAINCGFGVADSGRLPLTALDLDAGWVNFPRPKTGINRRCPLWPETVAAIREALSARPKPKDEACGRLAFLNVRGKPWHKADGRSPLCYKVQALLKRLGINGRKGLGIYTLRHNFETVAGEGKDQVAVDHIMGHADDSMAAAYREKISDERLRAVADHVRQWLFVGDAQNQPGQARTVGGELVALDTLPTTDDSDDNRGNIGNLKASGNIVGRFAEECGEQ
jgi:integrase